MFVLVTKNKTNTIYNKTKEDAITLSQSFLPTPSKLNWDKGL
jgi:hypothetical protein